MGTVFRSQCSREIMLKYPLDFNFYFHNNCYFAVQRSGSLQKFYHGKIRLAGEFENNIE